MPSNQYNYSSNDETAEDLQAELKELDWAQPESITEAAEILTELSNELDEFATGWSQIPPEEQEAVTDILNDTLERRTLAYEDTLDSANRDQLQESLNYLLDKDEPGLAFRLEQNVMASQRLESFREEFPGEPLTYGNLEKGVHETFVELAATIPQAMANYRHLLGDMRFQVAEQSLLNHEVNRLAYRLNLEINDRLLMKRPAADERNRNRNNRNGNSQWYQPKSGRQAPQLRRSAHAKGGLPEMGKLPNSEQLGKQRTRRHQKPKYCAGRRTKRQRIPRHGVRNSDIPSTNQRPKRSQCPARRKGSN